jgi:hypothetical protein
MRVAVEKQGWTLLSDDDESVPSPDPADATKEDR